MAVKETKHGVYTCQTLMKIHNTMGSELFTFNPRWRFLLFGKRDERFLRLYGCGWRQTQAVYGAK
ncbi:hypothetical protein DS901_06130 [Loktanella sp. D2R18]|nr:hypothetical protein DS901_06130 [Loktanella sp. D2R18]